MGRKDPIEVSVVYLHHTEKAVLVDDGGNEVWIPMSQVEAVDGDIEPDMGVYNRGEPIDLIIPEWLAEENGFI